MTSLFQSRTLQKIAASLLLVVFCTGFFSAAYVPQAYAQEEETAGSYYDGPTFEELFEKYAKQCAEAALIEFIIQAVLGFASTQVPVTDWASAVKDMIEDCLVSATKNALLELVTGQAVGWSQKGYGGNPSFVQNVTQYLLGIADQAAGTYIQNIGGGFLCSPFRSQVQLALTQSYQEASGRGAYGGGYGGSGGLTSCTLSEMAGVDAEAFLGGDFYAGGWDAWFEMVNNPYNTPYGAYVQTASELNRIVAEKAGESAWKLDFGNGFLSKETQNCYEVPVMNQDGTNSSFTQCDPPQVVTPGDTIKTSLEKSFGIKLDSIVAADEINEIISLVAVYLLTDILTEDEGLASYDYNADFEEPLVEIDGGVWGDDDGGGGGTPGDDEPAGPPGTPKCFVGDNFTPTEADVSVNYEMTLPPNVSYDKIIVDVDITSDGWPLSPNDPAYSIFYLRRKEWADLFGYVYVRGPSRNLVRLVHGVALPTEGKLEQTATGYHIGAGETHHYHYVYDTKNSASSLLIKKGSQTIKNFDGPQPNVGSVNTGDETRFLVELSFPGNTGNPYEVPSIGWDYRNLRIEFTNEGQSASNCSEMSTTGGFVGLPGGGGGGAGGQDPQNPTP